MGKDSSTSRPSYPHLESIPTFPSLQYQERVADQLALSLRIPPELALSLSAQAEYAMTFRNELIRLFAKVRIRRFFN